MPTITPRNCPHCGEPLKKYSVSAFAFSDGLGFGTPILQVCFNDDCPLFVKAWDVMFDRYGRVGSQRYWYDPFNQDEGALPVASRNAMKGDIITEPPEHTPE